MLSTLIKFYKGKRVAIRMDKTMNHSYQLKTTTKLLTSSLIFVLQDLFVYVCHKADGMTLECVMPQSHHSHVTVTLQGTLFHKEKGSFRRDVLEGILLHKCQSSDVLTLAYCTIV